MQGNGITKVKWGQLIQGLDFRGETDSNRVNLKFWARPVLALKTDCRTPSSFENIMAAVEK